jgi:hypothetical protein
VLLELHETASAQEVQDAFHKIARTAHPDLHRTGLDPSDLEVLTSAYAAVAGAYQQMRSMCMQTQRIRPIHSGEPRALTPPTGTPDIPATPSGAAPAANAAQSMSPKALLYYRKAELCLKRGDLKGAILQLKLACATDPTSSFLRTALAEVEIEVRKP